LLGLLIGEDRLSILTKGFDYRKDFSIEKASKSTRILGRNTFWIQKYSFLGKYGAII
jgi:hypothetical protein